MSGFVYILEMNDGKYYVGSTKNVENRLAEHQKGESKSTKSKLPVKLLYYKQYDTIVEAIHMETKLKKSKSRKVIEVFMKN